MHIRLSKNSVSLLLLSMSLLWVPIAINHGRPMVQIESVCGPSTRNKPAIARTTRTGSSSCLTPMVVSRSLLKLRVNDRNTQVLQMKMREYTIRDCGFFPRFFLYLFCGRHLLFVFKMHILV